MDVTEERFDALVRAYHDDLLRFATRRVGPDTAGDVVAEVFLIAWRRRNEAPVEAARLWLFGVANGVIANERRGRERRMHLVAKLAVDIQIVASAPEEPLDVVDAVLDAMTALPPHEQEALRLTEWDGLSLTEAAVVAGCSYSTFRVRVHRARRRLARRLDSLHPDAHRAESDRPAARPATATKDVKA